MKRKNGVIAMLVFSLVFFAAWVTFYVITMVQSGDFMASLAGIASGWAAVLYDYASGAFELVNHIIAYSVLGVWLIFTIILIAVAVKKKRGGFAFGCLLLLLLLLPAYDYGAYFAKWNDAITALFTAFTVEVLMSALIPICAALTTLFTLILYFLVVCSLQPKQYAEEAVALEEAPEEPAVEEEPAPVEAEEEPVVFEDLSVEPAPHFVAEAEPEEELAKEEEKEEPVAEEVKVEEPAPTPEPAKEEPKEDLKSLLKEIVRDIVRDELARRETPVQPNTNTNTVTGATFGGPLVVQYFNGCLPGQVPVNQTVTLNPTEQKPFEEVKTEEKKEEAEPAPEEAEPAPAGEEEVVEEEPIKEEEVKEEAAPVEEVAEEEPLPIEEPAEEKKPIVRIPFSQRLLEADEELKKQYNDLKNYILSYGLNCRTSNSGDAFRLHRKTYVKMNVAGKSLKLYLALDPADYADSKMPISDASNKAIYAEIPLVFKVKSPLSYRRALQLISDACEKDGLEQGEIGEVDWVAELAANAPSEEDDED